MSIIKAQISSESNEWFTPTRYTDMVKAVFDGGYIDLDPCSCEAANQTIGAMRYWTIDDDAMKQDWLAQNIFMNPPYGKVANQSQAGLLCMKMLDAYYQNKFEEGIILVNSCTGAGWFQPLFDWTICFVDHRIRYVSPDGKKNQPTKDNVFVYVGPNWQRFVKVFSTIGRCRIRSAVLPQFVDKLPGHRFIPRVSMGDVAGMRDYCRECGRLADDDIHR